MILGDKLVQIHGIEKLEVHMNIQRELILESLLAMEPKLKDEFYVRLYFKIASTVSFNFNSLKTSELWN